MQQTKVNYQREMEKIISAIPQGARPRLLLHSCCGPCSSAVLERLIPHFDVTVFYDNPNIAPEAEYQKRLEEQRRLLGQMPIAQKVHLLCGVCDPQRFYAVAKGMEGEPEGGARCTACFRLRLEATAKAAREGGFDYFTTTLSVSPHKDAQRINRLGGEIAQEHGVAYLYADFKKKEGYKRSIALSREYDLYRQDYCGCVYSLAAAKSGVQGEA